MTYATAYQRQLGRLADLGARVGPRGHGTRELLDESIRFDNSHLNILVSDVRQPNYRFMVAEWLWMMFGRSDVSTLVQYNKEMAKFSDDGIKLAGAYGPHFRGQLPRVRDKFKADLATRQAVVQVPRPYGDTRDEPCTLALQFIAREGRLHCIATMRSSDIWLGVPYDVFSFTQFQGCLAGELGLRRGWFTLRAGSSHLYDSNLEDASRCFYAPIGVVGSPDLPGFPPYWLEEVLTHRRISAVPPDAHPTWHAYARALLVNTSAAALDQLRAIA